MANQTGSNPQIFDTTGTITGHTTLRLLQWVDDNADIADNDDLAFTLNGVNFVIKAQRAVAPEGVVLYQIGPFNPSVPMHSFEITVIDHGTLHVWTT